MENMKIEELINSLDQSNLEMAYQMLKKQPLEESVSRELLNRLLCDMKFNHLPKEESETLNRIVALLDIENLFFTNC